MNKILNLSIIALSILSCTSKEKKAETDITSKTKYEEVVNYVDTIALQKQVFNKQIVCNGKLRAIAKCDVVFPTTGQINDIKAYNGTVVKKGDLLASLDTSEATIELNKAEGQMEKARIDLLDKLIGQGYDSDTTKIPAAIMKSMKISSGYNNALESYEAAQRRFDNCFVRAPFDGRVANMDSKLFQRSTDKLCTLINDSYFDVEFNLLEAELGEVAVGQKINVTPFVDDKKEFTGEITQINPLIDDKGQVKIRAKVANNNGLLIEGMNVKIIISNQIKDQFVVPKDAVLIRDGYYVLFRYIDGAAVWTYIDVVMSNIDSHVISGNTKKQTNITENDIVITTGNLNLADGTKVTPNK